LHRTGACQHTCGMSTGKRSKKPQRVGVGWPGGASMTEKIRSGVKPEERFVSLDFFRGLTMFFLIAESTSIYDHLVDPALGGTVLSTIGTQFHHHPWNGLRFWDLIQPFFMFIV